MRRTRLATAAILAALMCGLGSTGCNREVAGQVATLSSAYLGDVVTVVVTGYLHDVLGIENSGSLDGHSDETAHSHEAESLHDHEH